MLKLRFIILLASFFSVSNTLDVANQPNLIRNYSKEFALLNFIRGSPSKRTKIKQKVFNSTGYNFYDYLKHKGFVPRWFSKIVKHGGCTPYQFTPKKKVRC